MTETYYDILGVSPDASASEIKDGFRTSIKKEHPDVNDGDIDATEKSKDVTKARDVLTEQRSEYDRCLSEFGPHSGHESFREFEKLGYDSLDLYISSRQRQAKADTTADDGSNSSSDYEESSTDREKANKENNESTGTNQERHGWNSRSQEYYSDEYKQYGYSDEEPEGETEANTDVGGHSWSGASGSSSSSSSSTGKSDNVSSGSTTNQGRYSSDSNSSSSNANSHAGWENSGRLKQFIFLIIGTFLYGVNIARSFVLPFTALYGLPVVGIAFVMLNYNVLFEGAGDFKVLGVFIVISFHWIGAVIHFLFFTMFLLSAFDVGIHMDPSTALPVAALFGVLFYFSLLLNR